MKEGMRLGWKTRADAVIPSYEAGKGTMSTDHRLRYGKWGLYARRHSSDRSMAGAGKVTERGLLTVGKHPDSRYKTSANLSIGEKFRERNLTFRTRRSLWYILRVHENLAGRRGFGGEYPLFSMRTPGNDVDI